MMLIGKYLHIYSDYEKAAVRLAAQRKGRRKVLTQAVNLCRASPAF